jgi:hypothetical protein
MILLISVSWVAKITGMSHWRLAQEFDFFQSPFKFHRCASRSECVATPRPLDELWTQKLFFLRQKFKTSCVNHWVIRITRELNLVTWIISGPKQDKLNGSSHTHCPWAVAWN